MIERLALGSRPAAVVVVALTHIPAELRLYDVPLRGAGAGGRAAQGVVDGVHARRRCRGTGAVGDGFRRGFIVDDARVRGPGHDARAAIVRDVADGRLAADGT